MHKMVDRPARKLVVRVRHVSVTLQTRPGAAAVEEARSGQHITRQLQTDLQFGG